MDLENWDFEERRKIEVNFNFVVKKLKLNKSFYLIFFLWHCDPTRVMTSSFLRFLDHTQRRTTDE